MKRVCIIGCGAAGLAAARRSCLECNGLECVVYEQSDCLGGTWVYTEEVGVAANGLPVHSSMYRGLRTNLPKEVMGYPDFPIAEQERSYITSEEILAFLNSYCDHHNLRRFIKFNHHVKTVKPLECDRWEVTVLNPIEGREFTEEFDAIMVCNGHYHTPFYAQLKGVDSFPGRRMHSHDYREPSCFQDKRVVIVGAGPSGIDLSIEASSTASHVILSRREDMAITSKFPDRVEQRPEIVLVDGSRITFKDGSSTTADMIFYCTGYRYNFPFLSDDCGVVVEDNAVRPLYKHLIHIERPTMCFIGLPYYVCAFSLFDLQSRFFLKTLKGEVQLPSRKGMEEDTRKEFEERRLLGMKSNQFHMMGPLQGRYYDDLAKMGGLEPVPPVMARLHTHSSETQMRDAVNFRLANFRIVDAENYIQVN